MKKKNIIISIACSIFFIICVGATIILFPKVKEETIAYSTSIECKLRSNGMPVPLLRNGYSIFNGTKYR